MSNRPVKEFPCGKVKISLWQGSYESKPTFSFSFSKLKKNREKGKMEWVKLDFASEPDLRDLSFAINAVLTNSVLKKSNGAGFKTNPSPEVSPAPVQAEELPEDDIPF